MLRLCGADLRLAPAVPYANPMNYVRYSGKLAEEVAAKIGYPPVRLMSPPDMQFHPWLVGMRQAMELMLTGDAMSGSEAAATGFANRAFPAAELDDAVLAIAQRVALVPSDVQQLNKRSIHRAMEIMGARAAIRAGTEIQALAFTTDSSRAYMQQFRRDGSSVSEVLSRRDKSFGDYRERTSDS
jgi:enoyl-CoA hydratase